MYGTARKVDICHIYFSRKGEDGNSQTPISGVRNMVPGINIIHTYIQSSQ